MRDLRIATAVRILAIAAFGTLLSLQVAIGADCSACSAPTVTLHFKLLGQLAGIVTTTLKAGDEETVHVLTGGSVQLDSGSGRYFVGSFGCSEWNTSQRATVHLGEPIVWTWSWVTDDTDPAYTEVDPDASPPLLMNVSLPEAPCLRFFVQVPGASDFVPYEGGLVTASATTSPQQTWRFKVEISAPNVDGTLASANAASPLGAGVIKEEPRDYKFHNSGDLGPLCGAMSAAGPESGALADESPMSVSSITAIVANEIVHDGLRPNGVGAIRARHAFNLTGRMGVDRSRSVRGAGRHLMGRAGRDRTDVTTLTGGVGVVDAPLPSPAAGAKGATRVPELGASTVFGELELQGGEAPDSTAPPGVTPGEFLARSVGALHMELSLGTGLGSLIYESPAIDAGAYTPSRLRFDSVAEPLAQYSDSQGAIRQALFPTGLLDIVVIDSARFEVRFFGFGQIHESGGGYTIDDDNPAQRWLIENPDPEPSGRVRFTGVRDGVTQVHLASWQPPGANDSGRMTLSLFNDAVIEERTYVLDMSPTAPTRTERITRRRGPEGLVEEDRLMVYGEFYHWGDEGEVFDAVIAETGDPDGAALTTYYGYYDQPTQPGGNLSWMIHPDGYWEAYDRYQTTGELARTFRPWIDDPAGPFVADTSNSLVTTVTYQYPQPNIEVKIEDTIWKNSVRIGYRITTTTLEPDGDIVETTESFLSAASSLVSETVKGSWQGPLRSSYEARGTLRTRNRIWGYLNPTDKTFGFAPASGRIVAERTIEVEGTLDQPVGIPNETTIELRYTDDRGRVLLEETYVNDGNVFFPGLRSDWIAQRTNDYNLGGQLVQSTENGRIVFEAGYDADGRAEWSTDELGIRTEFQYDDFGRVSRTVRIAGGGTPDVTTTFEFDAAGRVVRQTVESGAGADALTETTSFEYDIAGRLIRTTAPDGLVREESETMLIGANGLPQRRQVVTTNPDGSQEIAEFYRDRRMFRRYGSAVPAEFWGYGVNGYGRVSAAFRDLGATQLRGQTISDWTGNTLFDVKPGFTGQGFYVVQNTFGGEGPFGTVRGLLVSRKEPGMATRLFEHDSRGRVVASGLDLNANGVLDHAGSDPVAISNLRFEIAGSPSEWSRVERNLILETEGSDAETLVSETREKLGQLAGGLAASMEVRAPGGARTSTEVSVDRAATMRTTTIRDFAADESTPPAVAVETGGLLRTIRTPEAAADTVYEYDALGRVRSVTSPQTGTTTYTYDSAGRLEKTTDSLMRESLLAYHPQGQAGAGRVSASTDAAGNATRFAYDTRGRIWRQWGVNVYPQEFGYDDDSRLTELRTFRTIDDSAGGGVDWSLAEWPANSPAGDLTQWIYDPSGLISRKRYADGTEFLYAYDSARRVSSRTNARGQTITHGYNALGHVESTDYPAGSLAADCIYLYDRAGRVSAITDASGIREMTYDPASGGVMSETYVSGVLEGLSVEREFDEFGRLDHLEVPSLLALGWEFDGFGRPERISGTSGSAGLEVTYAREPGFDRLQNIEWRQGESLQLRSNRSYDSVSRLTQVATRDGQGGLRQSHAYSVFDELDRRKRVDREDGKAWEYAYDARGQLTSAELRDAAAQTLPGHDFSFAFDTIGNRTRSAQGSLVSSYQPNALNQYVHRTVPGAIRVVGTSAEDAHVTADYRAAERQGDWFKVDIPVSNTAAPLWKQFDVVAVRSNAGPNGEDEVASDSRSAFVARTPESFQHDADGNLARDGRWEYTWDAENRLVAMETRAEAIAAGTPGRRLEFLYDCGSRRISKKVSNWTGSVWELATHTLFLYDGWNLIAEFDALSGQTPTRTYVWGLDLSGSWQGAGGVGGLVAVIDSSGTHAPWWDGNGNVTGYSNLESGAEEARYAYGPFGETLGATGPLVSTFTHRFSTKFTDPETSLLYYGFRYYSPSLGRWLSRDPLGENAVSNAYDALGNDFGNRADLLGLITIYIHGVNSDHTGMDALRNKFISMAAYERPLQYAIDLTWAFEATPLEAEDGVKFVNPTTNASDSIGRWETAGDTMRDSGMSRQHWFAAAKLKGVVRQIRELKERFPCLKDEPINIVAHSQGTIITMAALIRGMEVDDAIFMGSPFDKESKKNFKDYSSASENVGMITHLWSSADDTARLKGGIGGFGMSGKMITENTSNLRLRGVDHYGKTGWWAGKWLEDPRNQVAFPSLERVIYRKDELCCPPEVMDELARLSNEAGTYLSQRLR